MWRSSPNDPPAPPHMRPEPFARFRAFFRPAPQGRTGTEPHRPTETFRGTRMPPLRPDLARTYKKAPKDWAFLFFSYLCDAVSPAGLRHSVREIRHGSHPVFGPTCARAHSSVGQSSGLIIRRSWDHAPLGPPKKDSLHCGSFLQVPIRRLRPSAPSFFPHRRLAAPRCGKRFATVSKNRKPKNSNR